MKKLLFIVLLALGAACTTPYSRIPPMTPAVGAFVPDSTKFRTVLIAEVDVPESPHLLIVEKGTVKEVWVTSADNTGAQFALTFALCFIIFILGIAVGSNSR